MPSIWALELLLLLRRSAPQAMTADQLVQALRASPGLINRLLEHFVRIGLVMQDETGAYRFQCARPDLEQMCDALGEAADHRPVALRDAIVMSPNDKLRNFADAFRFKDKEKKDE